MIGPEVDHTLHKRGVAFQRQSRAKDDVSEEAFANVLVELFAHRPHVRAVAFAAITRGTAVGLHLRRLGDDAPDIPAGIGCIGQRGRRRIVTRNLRLQPASRITRQRIAAAVAEPKAVQGDCSGGHSVPSLRGNA